MRGWTMRADHDRGEHDAADVAGVSPAVRLRVTRLRGARSATR